MGTSNSTPIMCTPVGAALYAASMTVSISCGTVNVIGILRRVVDDLRYWNWKENKVSQAANPVLYYHLLSLIHMFTYMRINGSSNSGKTSLNTETISRKLAEETIEERKTKVTQGGKVLKQSSTTGNQSNALDSRYASTWTSQGPTKTTKTINIDEVPGADGKMVQTRTKTTLTTTSKATNQIYTVSVGSEFEFTLKFDETVTKTSSDGKSNTTKVAREFTYWIRALKASNGSAYPDVYVHTNKDQPEAYQYLMDLKMEIPYDDNKQLNPRALLIADTK